MEMKRGVEEVFENFENGRMKTKIWDKDSSSLLAMPPHLSFPIFTNLHLLQIVHLILILLLG